MRAMKWWPKISSIVLTGVLFAVAIYWALQLRAPTPALVPLTPVLETPAFDLSAQAHLFGAEANAAVVDTASNIRLAGVIAPGKQKEGGVALLAVDEKPLRAFRSGDTVAPGTQLIEVQKDRVIFQQSSGRSEVLLPKPIRAKKSTPETP